MAIAGSVQPVLDLLLALRDKDEDNAARIVSAAVGGDADVFAALVRSSVHYAEGSAKLFRKTRNSWVKAGRPHLKRTQSKVSIDLLSDGTVDAMVAPMELFLAAYGINAQISVGAFDSVEHEAIVGEPKSSDATLVILSEYWLRRHVQLSSATVSDLESAKEALSQIIEGLSAKRSGLIVISTFYQGAWPAVGGTATVPGKVSWANAIGQVNAHLTTLSSERVLVVDTQTALHAAGGAAAAGRLATVRMHAPFEEAGFIGLARETSSILASAFGRSHRALLTDWDNTLWGGEVGEVGFGGILCGPETPDGYGYHILQSYIRDLTALGVLVAAVSRNDPSMAGVLDENPHLALRRQHFASLKLSWGDKSQSVREIALDLNFGTDLMVYIDDNHVDLAEVLSAHPEIDVVLAGPDPDQSLTRLSLARYFNTARITDSDLQRTSRAQVLQQQRTEMASATSKEAFLESLDIVLEAAPVIAGNRERVLQLLQKTNQFNLTTRRHTGEDLDRLIDNGARIGVFDYRDRFGSQGVIGLLILKPQPNSRAFEIDTWLMSCRVLNRGVEEQMLSWAKDAAQGADLLGSYLPTAKNGLVRDLYPRLGFLEDKTADGRYALKTNN